MERSASKVFGPLFPLRARTRISQLQTPAGDRIAEADDLQEVERLDATGGIKPKKFSARERLDNLSNFRLYPSAIDITPSGVCRTGGKSGVAEATFRRRFWQNKKQVAVKKLNCYQLMDMHKFSNEFAHEVELMAGLTHENIVRFIGFVEDLENRQAWIVMSWEPHGNVREFLATGKCEILERIFLIQDTFEGLKYLHTRQPPICHGDLKSLNILVSSSYRAVITDFGSARVLREPADGGTCEGGDRAERGNVIRSLEKDCSSIHVSATGNQLTLTGPSWSLRWAPPEVVNGNRPSLPSDIWSAGWVCWEIMTSKLPFQDLDSKADIAMKVVEGQVPSAHEEEQLSQIARLCILMADCWLMDPENRPTISQCCAEVKLVPSLHPLGGATSDSKASTGQFLLQTGRMHYDNSRYEEAASCFMQVREVLSDSTDQSEIAAALHWLGNVAAAQGKNRPAEAFYMRAERMYSRIGGTLDQSNLIRQGVHDRQSKYAKVDDSFRDEQDRAKSLCQMAKIYHAQNMQEDAKVMQEDAKVYFREAQEIYARISDEEGQADTLHGLGGVHHFQSEHAEAYECFTRAHSIYARNGDDVGQANALMGLGGVYSAQSKYMQAESSWNQALEINVRIGNDEGHANALYGLGEVYSRQFRYNDAVSSYTRAQEIYVSIDNKIGQVNASRGLEHTHRAHYERAEDDSLGSIQTQGTQGSSSRNKNQADALLGLGEVYDRRSDHVQAASFYSRAHETYARIDNDEGRANALYGLGNIHHYQLKYAEAASSYNQAQAIYARIGSDNAQANAFYGLGKVYCSQLKFAEAASSYKQAQMIYERIGNENGQANALQKLGDVYRDQYNYTKALSPYTKAREIYARIQNDDGQASALCALGEMYCCELKYAEAVSSYTQAQGIYDRICDDRGRANARYKLGDIDCRRSRYGEAIRYFIRAGQIYRDIDDDEGQAKAWSGLEVVFRRQLKFTEAESSNAQAQMFFNRAQANYGRI